MFQVGDRVRLVETPYHDSIGPLVGCVGTVRNIHINAGVWWDDWHFGHDLDGHGHGTLPGWYVMFRELELASSAESVGGPDRLVMPPPGPVRRRVFADE